MVPSERISWETSRTTWNKPYSRCGNSVLDAICSTRLHDFRGKHPKTPQVTEVFLKQKDDEPEKPVIWLIWGNITLCMEVVLHSSWICKFPSVSQNFLSFCLGLERCSSFAIHAFQIINAEGATDHPIPVSQSLNMIYHAPASLWVLLYNLVVPCFTSISSRGDRLRVINTTLTIGSRAFTARTEVSYTDAMVVNADPRMSRFGAKHITDSSLLERMSSWFPLQDRKYDHNLPIPMWR
jgi:hypothetical protein